MKHIYEPIQDTIPIPIGQSNCTNIDIHRIYETIDEVVNIHQSNLLVEKLKEHGVPYHYEKFLGWIHTMDLVQDVNERCVYLMKQYFKDRL